MCMCDNSEELINELQSVGFNPLIIDEHTDFTTLPHFEGDTRSEDEIEENFQVEEEGVTYDIKLDKKGKPKTNAIRNRTAGHNWERDIVLDLKSIGYTQATTSRNASKARDDEKVDIMNLNERQDGFLPFDIQAKCTSAVSGFDKFLKEMKDNTNTVRVILLRLTSKALSRFMKQGEFAIMYYKDWLYYIKMEKEFKELKEKYNNLLLSTMSQSDHEN